MTESEWLKHGYSMGVVEPDVFSDETFSNVYWMWFSMKSGKIKPQSLDRIECTYKRYFNNNTISAEPVARMDEVYISEWLTRLLVRCGTVTYKEFCRIMGIMRGVMVYARDLELKGVKLIDWDKILRYMPDNRIEHSTSLDVCIPRKDIDALFKAVLDDDVYPLKESACLCLLMNFYLGLRVGELSALTWQDIDYSRRVINISRTEVKYFMRNENMEREDTMTYHEENGTKTLCSTRSVPICDECMYLLHRLKRHHEISGYTDTHLAYDGSQTVLVRSLDRTLRKLCKLCEIPVYNTHKIRKTCASYLHDSRVPIKTISDLLGHTNISTTARFYLRNTLDDEHMVDMVNGAFKNLVDITKK